MEANRKTWIRVKAKDPCAICRKPDWCTKSADGRVACCMRVQSDRPARNGGWLHRLDGNTLKPVYVPPIRPEQPAYVLQAAAYMSSLATAGEQYADLAQHLGLPVEPVKLLSPRWSKQHNAWAFPMFDAVGKMIGIRLRDYTGRKWAVKGSLSGLFIPSMIPRDVVYVCEGPTDTAAALSLGVYAVGRASCSHGGELLRDFCRNIKARFVVMLSDGDDPGLRGAESVSAKIGLLAKIWAPPTKDLRAYVLAGGNIVAMESELANVKWKRYVQPTGH